MFTTVVSTSLLVYIPAAAHATICLRARPLGIVYHAMLRMLQCTVLTNLEQQYKSARRQTVPA